MLIVYTKPEHVLLWVLNIKPWNTFTHSIRDYTIQNIASSGYCVYQIGFFGCFFFLGGVCVCDFLAFVLFVLYVFVM